MKHTGDTRESAAITVVQQLIAEKAHLAIYKPQVSADQVFRDLEYEGLSSDVVRSRVTVCHDAVTACDDASAVVILTEWDHFKTDRI